MDNVLIVGAGFSAALVYSYCRSNKIDVICPSVVRLDSSSEVRDIKNLKINKLFGHRANSLSTLGVTSQPNVKLHNRTIIGGNSTVWGGFFDAELDFDASSALERIGAKLVRLSYDNTGSTSNRDSICQLQDFNGNIYTSAKLFAGVRVGNFYCNKIMPENNRVRVELVSMLNGKKYYSEYDKIFVCCGVFNAISIIHNSFNVDFFELTDFGHELRLGFKSNNLSNYSDTVIRYGIPRAINHFLGVQKKFALDTFNFPICIDQIFSKFKSKLEIEIQDNIANLRANANGFGDSIHYNNLKINGCSINQFLESISPNVVFFGMASLNQKNPGPISNDIHSQINEYFNKN
ncbi:hypothetical protein LMORI2_02760 [Limnohabitans sp. MORI2]|uniref:hypothetical protein n=1 Tax=Limnohabitans sp. MORI2 TaxID=1751150 RepID=UPI002377880D|nr:hypothetical protein [Limnohabitans sp. MORI2]BDU57294.1 hypothetical protein LMORI2_02760 [Limnohabitans sp. MORI2]